VLDKCILVVSDLHCGSIYGMLPPDFKTSADAVVKQNPLQQYSWKCWLDLARRVKDLPIAAVVVNGDVVDGGQQAQHGTELSLPMLEDQGRAAQDTLFELFRNLPSCPHFYTQGTEYHDSKAGREAELIAKNLGGKKYGQLANGTGIYSREFLDLEIDGVIVNFAHGISVAGGFYRATAVDREGIWSALAGKEGKLPKADAVIRSHCHFFVHVEHASKHIAITPCWQMQTRYMRKNSIYRMLPDIGAMIIWLDGDLKKKGEDPIVIRKIMYPLPPINTTKI
jgi:hypothetical protein